LEEQRIFLLAGRLDVYPGVTLGIRDYCRAANHLEISAVFLLAGLLGITMGGIGESENFLRTVPCTLMCQRYLCLQEYFRCSEYGLSSMLATPG